MMSQKTDQQENKMEYISIIASSLLFLVVLTISIVGMKELDSDDVCYNYQDENNFWQYVDGQKNLPDDAWNAGKHNFKDAFGLFFYSSVTFYAFLILHTLFDALHKYY